MTFILFFIIKLILIHIFAYFVTLFIFVILFNFFYKKFFNFINYLVVILKLMFSRDFVNQISIAKLKFAIDKNIANDFDFKTLFITKQVKNPLIKLKKKSYKNSRRKNNIKLKLEEYFKAKKKIFAKTGIFLQKKVFGIKYIYNFVQKIQNLIKNNSFFNFNNLKVLNLSFFLLVLFYLNLNLIYSLKFESTFLIFLFGFFVFLIYNFASTFIINYLNNEALLIYNFIIDEINLKKKNINLILNFQILNLSKIKTKLTKLNVKFLLILTDLFSLFFNNKKINDFLFFYYLIKLI